MKENNNKDSNISTPKRNIIINKIKALLALPGKVFCSAKTKLPLLFSSTKASALRFKSHMFEHYPDLMNFLSLESGKFSKWFISIKLKMKTNLKEKHPKLLNFLLKIKEKITGLLYKLKNWYSNRTKSQKKLIVSITIAAFVVIYIGYRIFFNIEMNKIPVNVVTPLSKTVPVYASYVGNTQAIKTMDVKARVEGFLLKRYFVEGADVKKDDLMFEIDSKPFKAALDSAEAQLAKDNAAMEFAKNQVNRYKPLVEKEYITKEDFDNYVTKLEEALAAVKSDEANVEQAQLNLSYCKMFAPFDGRIGRTLVNIGNLVGAGQNTKLATIVQLNPIYAYFSPSDEDINRILEYKSKSPISAELEFSDGSKYKHNGEVDFVDNIVDSSTSTVTMRAAFPNPEKILLPGQYVKVYLYLSDLPNSLLIPEYAIAEDQAGQYVMTVNKDNIIEQKKIKTASSFKGMKVIINGLNKDDLVITNRLQMLKPGMRIVPIHTELDLNKE